MIKLHLVKFAYNNSFLQVSVWLPLRHGMEELVELLYCWNEVGKRRLIGLELVRITSNVVKVIRNRFKTAQNCQKSYADKQQSHSSLTLGIMCSFMCPN